MTLVGVQNKLVGHPQARGVLQGLNNCSSVHHWHHLIEQDYPAILLGQHLESFSPVAGASNQARPQDPQPATSLMQRAGAATMILEEDGSKEGEGRVVQDLTS